MTVRKLSLLVLVLALPLVACGARHSTEESMLAWAQVLNAHLTTGGKNSYPHKLEEIDPMLRGAVSETDGWGNPFFYHRVFDTKYWLISAGEDGTVGNDDDVILENAMLREAVGFYAKNPLPQKG